MNKMSVWKKLSAYKTVSTKPNQVYFYSRAKPQGSDRAVLVVDQGESVVCLPLYINGNKEDVAFHAKTIKSLVEFLEGK